MLSCARGLLLTGGDDVDPRLYGGETHPHPKIGAINPMRDEFEMALTLAALELDIPILGGICRGAQILNVAAGGEDLSKIFLDAWMVPMHIGFLRPGGILLIASHLHMIQCSFEYSAKRQYG